MEAVLRAASDVVVTDVVAFVDSILTLTTASKLSSESSSESAVAKAASAAVAAVTVNEESLVDVEEGDSSDDLVDGS